MLENSNYYLNKLNKYNRKLAFNILKEKEKEKTVSLTFLIFKTYKNNKGKINKDMLEKFVIKKYYETI